MMRIRKAILADAQAISKYILLAMGDIIYQFTGRNDDNKAKEFMLHFVSRANNQYSYENCWVAEEENQIIAAACVYPGAKINLLRAPILAYLKEEYDRILVLEDETQAGEMYIDSFGVDQAQQGKGVGSEMLQFLIKEYVLNQHQTLGLLVDRDNPDAKCLYLKLGFKVVGQKDFAGKVMDHLQISPAYAKAL